CHRRKAGRQRCNLHNAGNRQHRVEVSACDDDRIETRRRADQPIVLAELVVQIGGQQYTHLANGSRKKQQSFNGLTPMIESLLLTATRIFTFDQQQVLTNASAFFFERDSRLFLVTSRHVLIDEPTEHRPDRVEIELHTDADNMASSTAFSIPLYRNGEAVWHQGIDAGGQI